MATNKTYQITRPEQIVPVSLSLRRLHIAIQSQEAMIHNLASLKRSGAMDAESYKLMNAMLLDTLHTLKHIKAQTFVNTQSLLQ